jgi:hypothetical protein
MLRQKRKALEKRTAMIQAEFELANANDKYFLSAMGAQAYLLWMEAILQSTRTINAEHRKLNETVWGLFVNKRK